MQLADTNQFAVGAVLKRNLYRLTGELVLEGGTKLAPLHVQALRTVADRQCVLADSLEELAAEGLIEKLNPERDLLPGEAAKFDVISRRGRMLLSVGQKVEPHHLLVLADGGYRVCPQETHAGRVHQECDRILMTQPMVDKLEKQVAARSGRIRPAWQPIWETAGAERPEPWPGEQALSNMREQEVREVDQWLARLLGGAQVAQHEINGLIDRLYRRLIDHRERFTQLALLCRRREGYLADQAYSVAVLAMATAAQMNWTPEDVRRAGLAGLLADVGMLLVPWHIRMGEGKLKEHDRQLVERHPAYSAAMLEQVAGIEPVVRWAVYQHHEREGGIGYPCMRRGDHISDLARVLAVADVFAAGTSPRHHREARLPYHIMEQIIRAAASGVFHKPATRALVQAAGLFPVGSCVELSDGRQAYVLATHADLLDRPVVRLIRPSGEATDEVVDLSVIPAPRLTVARPIATPEPAEAAGQLAPMA